LNFFSEHPHHTKKSIPYSLAQRIKRICTQRDELHENLLDLRGSLSSAGYPKNLVEDAIDLAMNPGEEIEQPLSQPVVLDNKDWKNKTKFITAYNAKNPNFNRILNQHISLLTTHDLGAFDDLNIGVVHKRQKNLSDELVHSNLNKKCTVTAPRGLVCTDRRCLACPKILNLSTVTSTSNNFKWDIRQSFSCHTRDCVYMLECSVCRLQYIGHTESTFNLRLNNQRRDSMLEGPIYDHMVQTNGEHSFDKFGWIILKSNFNNNTKNRENFESWLINMFDLFRGAGLNKTPGVFTNIIRSNRGGLSN
jgi:hypothetical protein